MKPGPGHRKGLNAALDPSLGFTQAFVYENNIRSVGNATEQISGDIKPYGLPLERFYTFRR